ncbi:YqhG family protein [Jeotgalibacillus terrae]|uniref:YqhG family protein n=1 Tax=Jeotgalibacillus terrae TaxID=587735 RepID=A0ABW5ZKP6_9BACL|nr:YqhG family protein [Jeotgalibacillus terrae]MBM7577571.1 disulfide oxidoreductase YuzD [Jeotgalibacillus terrae]
MMKEAYKLVIEYLKCNGAVVTESANKAVVQLTEQLDRKFMNRPFYWHYRDALNQSGDPMHLIVQETPGQLKANDLLSIHYDHHIFQSILVSAQQENQFYTAFEKSETPCMLYPWITIQLTASFTPPGLADIRINSRISLITGIKYITSNLSSDTLSLSEKRPNGSILQPNRLPFATAISILYNGIENEVINQTKDVQAVQVCFKHISAGLIYLRSFE